MSIKSRVLNLIEGAKRSSRILGAISTKDKDKALSFMAENLLKRSRYILFNNAKDVALAKKKDLSEAMIDRLKLTDKRIQEMSDSIKSIIGLSDPVGRVISESKRPNGLLIKKVRTPIGVVGIIYESRPNVTSDCASLCLKSGNACVLRGGSESINSNIAIHKAITENLDKFGVPKEAITLIDTIDREAIDVMLKANGLIDVVIPRGGEKLIKKVVEASTIPVIKHYKGVCNLYVDRFADIKKARDITINAKTQRPGVCNAIENLLVHKDIAKKFLPEIGRLLKEKGVELRGCKKTMKILKGIKKAAESDYFEEYLGLKLAVKIVDDVNEAIEFIDHYGSKHSDAIVTKNKKIGEEFLKRVDSSCVYLNASTRFTDGYQFGLGAEIGISTDKIHARGPMALEELCTYKYIILGKGQVRL
ncbi:MAG: glutamate-5-semialdehyde dehydrogenase [Candidatus Omnitrophota bacterium]